ncbi:MAG: AAA family ATPase [Puniceicoccales bacterium]|jgi:endopeptidase Clp ATP-binding regulatory subunit ClpX|nr:AAA family ATPase [Puniceicoccales bacterium]
MLRYNEGSENPLEEITKKLEEIFEKSGIKPTSFSQKAGPEGDSGCGDDANSGNQGSDAFDPIDKIKSFNLKPVEVKEYLDRFVICQDEAKKVLAVAVCDHYNHVRSCISNIDKGLRDDEYNKQNILLFGPTGVGKTYLVKTIARLIGVPFVKADATKFSETGYVGADVDDLVRDLVKAANGNIDLAKHGIIFIDEIDKIASVSMGESRDISGRGVQINLLKLMEDTDVNILSQTDIMNQMRAFVTSSFNKKNKVDRINTQHILFIVSGAFDRIVEITNKRLGQAKVGFGGASRKESVDDFDVLQQVNTEDLIKYGFEPEFIGRLPVRVACRALGKSELKKILISSKGSILKQYINDFAGYGIKLSVQEDALEKIAESAEKEKTGARGLLTILERIFRDFKFELPSTSVKTLDISADDLANPDKLLAELMQKFRSSDVKIYSENFPEKFD